MRLGAYRGVRGATQGESKLLNELFREAASGVRRASRLLKNVHSESSAFDDEVGGIEKLLERIARLDDWRSRFRTLFAQSSASRTNSSENKARPLNKRAQRAFEQLVRSGCTPDVLASFVTEYSYEIHREATQPHLHRHRRAIRRLRQRILNLYSHLDDLHRSGEFKMLGGYELGDGVVSALREEAARISIYLRNAPAFTRTRISRSDSLVLFLLRDVQWMCGAYNYPLVADLVSSFRPIKPGALRQWRSRQRAAGLAP